MKQNLMRLWCILISIMIGSRENCILFQGRSIWALGWLLTCPGCTPTFQPKISRAFSSGPPFPLIGWRHRAAPYNFCHLPKTIIRYLCSCYCWKAKVKGLNSYLALLFLLLSSNHACACTCAHRNSHCAKINVYVEMNVQKTKIMWLWTVHHKQRPEELCIDTDQAQSIKTDASWCLICIQITLKRSISDCPNRNIWNKHAADQVDMEMTGTQVDRLCHAKFLLCQVTSCCRSDTTTSANFQQVWVIWCVTQPLQSKAKLSKQCRRAGGGNWISPLKDRHPNPHQQELRKPAVHQVSSATVVQPIRFPS